MRGLSKKNMKYDKIMTKLKKNVKERSIEAAIEIAKSIIDNLSIKEYPVSIVRILSDLGFSIYATETESNISGFILISPDLCDKFETDRIIAVDRNDSYGRQRFTLAHELACFFFNFDEERDMCFVSECDADKEDEDDGAVLSGFAAELLMPTDLFIARYHELDSMSLYEKGLQLVSDFAVPQKLVSERIEELRDQLGAIKQQ